MWCLLYDMIHPGVCGVWGQEASNALFTDGRCLFVCDLCVCPFRSRVCGCVWAPCRAVPCRAVQVVPEEDEGRALGSPCGGAVAGVVPGGPPGSEQAAAEEAVLRRGGQQVLREALEVAVTSALSHPNILQLYVFFTDVLVVEYEGEAGRYRLLRREDAGPQYANSELPIYSPHTVYRTPTHDYHVRFLARHFHFYACLPA